MNHAVFAWAMPPSVSQLVEFLSNHSETKNLIFCLQNNVLPTWTLPEHPNPIQQKIHNTLNEINQTLVFDAVNFIANIFENTDLWLMPPSHAAHLAEHFRQPEQIFWQTNPISQIQNKPLKTWQIPPENLFRQPEKTVLIIGAGISGAATAYECAIRGAKVIVLEAKNDVAQAASGNRQGLLYAKISPHLTAQTELLLSGYGYTRRLLARLLPEKQTWRDCGVLHLNHDAAETARNAKLAQNAHYRHLYRAVDSDEASELAGIEVVQSGLFWAQGAWLNPKSVVEKLLQHENISVYTHSDAQHIEYKNNHWIVQTQNGEFSGSHIVFCTGADQLNTPFLDDFKLQFIRGQTSVAPARSGSLKLKTALSGASYISPSWNGKHCFGATFMPNNSDRNWQKSDDEANISALRELNSYLAANMDLSGEIVGHTAMRCDCYDHLPAVGALGDAVAMRQVYAKLALDKNYRIDAACPYLPNAYLNTAHGSRGLATAPICGAQIAAQICDTPKPLSERLRVALNPNRLIIRDIVRRTK